jgi:hypothetical protein
MMTRLTYYLWVVFHLSYTISVAQMKEGDACKVLLLRATETYQQSNYAQMPASQVKAFTITMHSEVVKGSKQVPDTKMNLYIGKNFFLTKGNGYVSVMDSIYCFTVVKITKVLVRNHSFLSKLKDSMSLGLNKQLLEQIDTYSCETIYKGTQAFNKISCMPNKNLSEYSMIEKLEYVIDVASKQLVSSKIYYKATSPVKSSTVTYSPMILAAKPQEFVGSLNSIFLTKNGLPKGVYQGFRFLDNIKK